MVLKELLKSIQDIAHKEGLSTPYIAGGMPRDKVLNRITKLPDIDITTGDGDSHFLARSVAEKYNLKGDNYKVLDDGHAQIVIAPFKIDFSSNFKAPGIRRMLKKAGMNSPTPMQEELYSRDFTCNAMLLTMDLKTIKDPTGLGMPDIKKKVLRTCLPADITLKESPKRIPRVFYLAAKLGFSVDHEIREWIVNNPEILKEVNDKYMQQKLTQAINYDENRTVRLLDSLKLWQHIPYMESLAPHMEKHIGRI